jgi:hypothetical protein
VSLLDSSLPSVLYHGQDVHLRDVIMAEMLADPGFDLLYGRLGSVFIPRDNGPQASLAVAELGATLDERSVAVIFSEGRLFRPELLERARQRLAARDPERAAGLEGLRSTPCSTPRLPRLGVQPGVGDDDHVRFAELVRAVPLSDPVRVTAWRTSRDEVPGDPAARAAWLDAQWRRVDAWIDDQLPVLRRQGRPPIPLDPDRSRSASPSSGQVARLRVWERRPASNMPHAAAPTPMTAPKAHSTLPVAKSTTMNITIPAAELNKPQSDRSPHFMSLLRQKPCSR